MIDVSKFAFIKATHHIKGDSTRLVKQQINAALQANKKNGYGALINESNTNTILFATDRSGLMPGATIFNEVAEHGNTVVISISGGQCYFFIVKNKAVIYENVLNIKASSESQVNTLKIALYELGKNATIVTNVDPKQVDDGLAFGEDLVLPLSSGEVIVKPVLDDILDTPKLIQATDMKTLSLNGQRIQRQWYFSLSSLCIAACTVIGMSFIDESHLQDNEMSQHTLTSLANLSEDNSGSTLSAVNYDGLRQWYEQDSIAPFVVLKQMHRDMRLFQSVEGWDLIKAAFSIESGQPFVSFVLKEGDNADIKTISTIASRSGWKISFDEKRFTVFKVVDTQPLFSNTARFHISSYEKFLSAGIKDWWDGTSFETEKYTSDKPKSGEKGDDQVGESTPDIRQPFEKRLIKIKKAEYTAFDLQSFGSLLKGHPYSLRSVTLIKESEATDDVDGRTRNRHKSNTQDNQLASNKIESFNAEYELILAGVNTR